MLIIPAKYKAEEMPYISFERSATALLGHQKSARFAVRDESVAPN
jgi:hypothetical protein